MADQPSDGFSPLSMKGYSKVRPSPEACEILLALVSSHQESPHQTIQMPALSLDDTLYATVSTESFVTLEDNDFTPVHTEDVDQESSFFDSREGIEDSDFSKEIEMLDNLSTCPDEKSYAPITPLNRNDITLKIAHPTHRYPSAPENTQLQVIGPTPFRYELSDELGSGGMGKVWLARDILLNREVALKSLHPHLMNHRELYSLFVQETQLLAQLQHPNILPVYDIGVLAQGTPYFTTCVIKGHSLSDVLKASAAKVRQSQVRRAINELKRLISLFHKVCLAIAFAHDRGIMHRDLKPSNIMVNEHGEVLVLDWGLATPFEQDSQFFEGEKTYAKLCGTPGFIAPEILIETEPLLDTAHDVFALGAIFFEILSEQALIQGVNHQELLLNTKLGVFSRFEEMNPLAIETQRIVTLHPEVPSESSDGEASVYHLSESGQVLPRPLVELCLMACAFDPRHRTISARELADQITDWLDGSRQREIAMSYVDQAKGLDHEIEQLKNQANRHRQRADELLKRIPKHAAESEKWEIWREQDLEGGATLEAELLKVKQSQLYRSALARKDDLIEAHIEFAKIYMNAHKNAEEEGHQLLAQQALIMLSEHVDGLPKAHPFRISMISYMAGEGSISLKLSDSDAMIELYFQTVRNRRIVSSESEMIGKGELCSFSAAMGSYLLKVSHPACHHALFPIYLGRCEHFTYADPSGERATLKLLPLGLLTSNERYVPAGWCTLGGDQGTPNSLPKTRVWIDGFVMQRFSVTHAEYIIFINELIERGDRDEAEQHVPREQNSNEETLGRAIYELDQEGYYHLPTDPQAKVGRPRQPVTLVMWRSARAYAHWLSEKDGKKWRLPMEYEWEKAARGVDARFYPWGNEHDPSWACMKDSHQGEIEIVDVDSFTADESIYGIRGLAGNTRDWCLDRFREEGPLLKEQRLVFPSEEDLADEGFKSTRGGSYGNSASRARSADRDWWFPNKSYLGRGFRLVWSVD